MIDQLLAPAYWAERKMTKWGFPQWLIMAISVPILTFLWMLPWTIIWSFVFLDYLWIAGFWGRLWTGVTAAVWCIAMFCAGND